MATHNIYGAEFTNPIFKVYECNIILDENENIIKMDVSINISDSNDSVSITFSALNSEIPIPSSTKITAVRAWVTNKLKEYKIQ